MQDTYTHLQDITNTPYLFLAQAAVTLLHNMDDIKRHYEYFGIVRLLTSNKSMNSINVSIPTSDNITTDDQT